MRPGKHLLVPEVIQISDMDCGPAALAAILRGFDMPVDYERLRQSCQTEVDGTSIDTLEDVAVQLGLDAEQVVVPADHVLIPEANLLPALAVCQSPGGVTHLEIAWNTVGPLVQMMDPSVGRKWISRARLVDELYTHSLMVPAAEWREWAGSEELLVPLRQQIASLGISAKDSEQLLEMAASDTSWKAFARLDAATRMLRSVVRCGGLKNGKANGEILRALISSAGDNVGSASGIPDAYWQALPCADDAAGGEQILLRGVVLIRVKGMAKQCASEPAADAKRPASPEWVASVAEQRRGPWRQFAKLLREEGAVSPLSIAGALLVSAATVFIEALLLRGLLDIGQELVLPAQRMTAVVMMLAFLTAVLALDLPLERSLLRLGRHLEIRVRKALLTAIPRLSDEYYRTRLTSDLAERGHSLHCIRNLSDLAGQTLRILFQILFTVAGICWIAPRSVWLAVATGVATIVVPFASQPLISERDLRFRTHAAVLCRFYLDTLLGVVPVRAQGAQQSVRREHEGYLVEWARAGLGIQRVMVSSTGVQFFVGFGLAAWLLLSYMGHSPNMASVLLLAFWALNLPMLGQDLGLLVASYPHDRNALLRALEPIDGADQVDAHEDQREQGAVRSGGVAIEVDNLTARFAGRVVLEDVSVRIASNAHVAILGASGAGKSSLLGVLLGWVPVSEGKLLIDGVEAQKNELHELRKNIAWVDPAVQLWNRTLYRNLSYGSEDVSATDLSNALAAADLTQTLEHLPDGLQSMMGESGGLVSGGEGQRVRFGRAWLRRDVRLALLDEPFRGLDREQRHRLLREARDCWRDATLLCVTHEPAETLDFDQVLIMQDGKIVEEGNPRDLQAQADSLYRKWLGLEEALRTELWSASQWRHVTVEDGKIAEAHPVEVS